MSTKAEKFRDILERFSRLTEAFKQLESQPRSFGTKQLLNPAEIHLIEAIGLAGEANVTDLAQSMGVTKGAISQKIRKLADMKLLRKLKVSPDMRCASITLTAEGKKAFLEHEKFHQEFFNDFIDGNRNFSLNDLVFFEKTLSKMESSILKIIQKE